MNAKTPKRSMADLFRRQREHDAMATLKGRNRKQLIRQSASLQLVNTRTRNLIMANCQCGQCDSCRMRSFVCRIQSIDPEKCPNGYLTGGEL